MHRTSTTQILLSSSSCCSLYQRANRRRFVAPGLGSARRLDVCTYNMTREDLARSPAGRHQPNQPTTKINQENISKNHACLSKGVLGRRAFKLYLFHMSIYCRINTLAGFALPLKANRACCPWLRLQPVSRSSLTCTTEVLWFVLSNLDLKKDEAEPAQLGDSHVRCDMM